MRADNGSLFAVSGGGAVGTVHNVFESMAMAIPLRVVSILPVELTH